jgi:PAS domain S-box-containing protein
LRTAINILIIDPHPDSLDSLAATLQGSLHGCQIETAGSGTAGIELARSFQPAVILLDLEMPGLDGIEICKQLKQNPVTQDIPVIFLTAQKFDQAIRILSLEAGGNAILSTPVEPGELLAQVRALLRITQVKEALSDKDADLERLETERQQAEEKLRQSQERFAQIAESLNDWIWEVDAGGTFLYSSPGVEKILGYSPDELVGKAHFYDLFPAAMREGLKAAALEAFAHKQPFRGFENVNVHKNGSLVTLETSGLPMLDSDGNLLGYRGVDSDITERKKTEASLQQYRDHLEELVDLRTMELSEARDQALAANLAKSTFLSNMSHELRTPLTAVIGFAQVMSQDRMASGQEKENLNVILRSGEHLLALINDILDFSKIEAGRVDLDLHDVDLGELFRDVADMMRGRAEAKGLQLVVKQTSAFPSFVNTDSGKLRQIIINLVGNAIKFTPAGQVTISLDARPAPDGHLLSIDVQDTGIGIGKDKLALIFQPFVQAGNRTMSEGTGLGLAISRQYVEMLGGDIMVASELHKGSHFHLAIPVGKADAGNLQALGRQPKMVDIDSPTSDIRILIVEDQPENRLLLQSLLSRFGFQTREAANGMEGIAAFQKWQPQLIFMDRRMPILDGIEATRRIRALPGGHTPIIIAVSAQTFKEEQREMLAAGCNGFLRKPFSIDDMLTTLGQHLKLKLRPAAPPPGPRMLLAADLLPVPVLVLRTLHRLILEGQHDDLLAWVNSQTVLAGEAARAMHKHLEDYQFEFLAKIIEPLIREAAAAEPVPIGSR